MLSRHTDLLDNKYKKRYINIITNAMGQPRKKGEGIYYEAHHYDPKSWGGDDDTVLLTAKEHFVCHHLLTKFSVGSKRTSMIQAFWCMCNTAKYKRVTSKTYELARTNHANTMKGENNPMFGNGRKGKDSHMYRRMGKDNNNFKGHYITPWGIFESVDAAIQACYKPISSMGIRLWCGTNNEKPVTKGSIGQSEYLQSRVRSRNIEGLTFAQLGFGFKPA